MKKRDDNKKEVTKIKLKKAKGSTVNKRTNQRVPDPWKEIRLKLRPLGKVYNKFIEKRRITKQKKEQRRLKLEEEQKLREERMEKIEGESKAPISLNAPPVDTEIFTTSRVSPTISGTVDQNTGLTGTESALLSPLEQEIAKKKNQGIGSLA